MEPSPASETLAPPQPRPRLDPEFAPDPYPVAQLPPHFPLAQHQRLVVNPFLAVAGLVVWAWVTRQLYLGSFPPVCLVPSFFLFWLPFLIHYHCLDCGQTGIYPRWCRHACFKTVNRANRDRPRWFRWPTARTQLIVWGYLLGSIGLLLAVVGAGVFLSRRH